MCRVLLFGLIVIPACTWRGDPATAKTETLRVAIIEEIGNLTPYSPGVPETLLGLVYDKLAAPAPYLADARPWLAESIMPVGDDGREWRIQLRDGIQWHDEKPFGAEDVAFTFRYYRDGPANRWTHHTNDTPMLEVIEVQNRLSLRVRCADPCPQFDRVTAADIPILPAHLWQGVEHPYRYSGPVVGTGPYRLAVLKPGRYLRLEANPGYFGGAPKIKTLLVSFIRNPATAFAALRAGELDLVAAPVPPELVPPLSRQPDLAVLEGNPLTAVEIRLNFDRQPFSDPLFRQALALGIKPDEVLARVALGYGRPGSHGYPHPESPWTAQRLSLRSDPAISAIHLETLGFVDRDGDGGREDASGRPLRFSFKISSSEPLHLRAAQVVKRQLKSSGIDLIIEVIDPARHRALFKTRRFDLMIAEISPHGLADPDQFIQSFQSGYLWRAGTSYPLLDTLINDWRQAETAERRLEAGFVLQRFFNRAPTAIVLYYPKSTWAYRPSAFKHWKAIPGLGLFHKWSLVQQEGNPVKQQGNFPMHPSEWAFP